MRELRIQKNEAGQRLDKLLKKYLKEAPGSFIYKMLRKKNILLNDKKADGTEILQLQDSVKMYFSEETFQKMRGEGAVPSKGDGNAASKTASSLSRQDIGPILHGSGFSSLQKAAAALRKQIIYEDEEVLLISKPAGWLSQMDGSHAVSANECCLAYLMETGQLSDVQLNTFKPGIANRLDRNTSGLLIFGKTLPALQALSKLLNDRTLAKYYLCVVQGTIRKAEHIQGYLYKKTSGNQVLISRERGKEAAEIHTEYEPLSWNGHYTLLRVHLITGKTHQIRAHLASCGHPLLGDEKYGQHEVNQQLYEEYQLRGQLLHAYELHFPKNPEGNVLDHLADRHFFAPLPQPFTAFLEAEKLPLS